MKLLDSIKNRGQVLNLESIQKKDQKPGAF